MNVSLQVKLGLPKKKKEFFTIFLLFKTGINWRLVTGFD